MTGEVILLAASGLAREVISSLEQDPGVRVVGCLDDTRDRVQDDFPVPVLGSIPDAVDFPDAKFVACAGSGAARRSIVARLFSLGIDTERFGTVVDQSVRIPRTCSVGAGSIVLAQSVLTADVWIGRHVVVMPQVTLTHDDRVEDYATLCAGVVLGGSVIIGESAYLGMVSSVRERLHVGRNAVLGMGSVLTKSLPPDETWVGTPASRLIRTPA